MRSGALGVLFALIVAGVVAAWAGLFSVHQSQQALVLQFGEVIDVVEEPGLHFKIPFVQNVVYFDRRILDLDTQPQEAIASDQKRLVVDAFARYRITNVLRFYQAVRTIEAANSQLGTLLISAVRRVLGESTFIQVVRDERPQLMARIAQQLNQEAQGFGITVVDVKIRRADLPPENSTAIFDRMKTERQREAAEIRAGGEEQSRRIRAEADLNAAVILAEANRRGEVLRGDGDAEANRIFVEAYSRDTDFFAFYRSMQAYERGLKTTGTRLVVSPDSTFFRFFENPAGTGTAQGSQPPGESTGAAPPRIPERPQTPEPAPQPQQP